MILGFGRGDKKKRLMDAARIAIQQIVENSSIPEDHTWWADSYLAGFLYSRSLEMVKYENDDKWDELCMEAWQDYWGSNYPTLFSYLVHFSSMKEDPEVDKELKVNATILEEFEKGMNAGRVSFNINTGRANSLDKGFDEAVKFTKEMIDDGIAPEPKTQTDSNHLTDIAFTRINLFDYKNSKDEDHLKDLGETLDNLKNKLK